MRLSAKRNHVLSYVVEDNSDFIRTFAVNREYTCTRSEKYSSRLDISRSFIRTFAVNHRVDLIN